MGIMTLAQVRENFLAAMETLRSSKVRSALTVLGIVIGVSSVISMAAIIEGLNKFVQDKVESLGSRTYFLTRFPPGMDPSHMPQRIRTRKYLEYNCADFVRQAAPDVQIVTTVGTRGFFLGDSNLITSGDHSVEKVIVRGAEPEYVEAIPLFAIGEGRFISAFDQEHARSVVVLGAAISESLFPNTDAVGKTVRINGAAYEVIGVFEHDQGLFLGPGVDIFAIIPLSNFKKRYPEAKELIMLFTIPKHVNIDLAQGEVIQAMRRLRRVPPDKDNDFELSSPDFISHLWNQLTRALVILTSVISSIGLLVGGLGVMNIMLISVTERTQEIGIRKAIGARRPDIRLQFLLEAVVLTLVGGTLGILIGACISSLVRTFVPSVPATLSYLWVSIGFAISVGVGLFFGYYPANVAADLDPIDCLRYE
jgi:putative ABC transport system permease protein